MTLATLPKGKTAARIAVETPYRHDNERSVERAMQSGQMPKSMECLVSWFRDVCAQELPVRLHKSGVWRDYGVNAEGGSYIGSPASTDAFRRFMENSPSNVDQDGYYSKPLRAALSRLNRRWPFMARHLYRLALVDGDWRLYARQATVWSDEEMQLYMGEALRRLWREYAIEVVRLD